MLGLLSKGQCYEKRKCTPVAEATAIVSNAPSAVVKARGEAVAVSVQVDQINRVGHAANRVYGEQFALGLFSWRRPSSGMS
jgi:hypothetical protein